MATHEVDLVEEIFGPAPDESVGQTSVEPEMVESTWPAGASVFPAPKPQTRIGTPVARARSGRRRAVLAAKLVVTFAITAIACLILVAAIALVALSNYSNRVVPGVRIGSLDVSGLSRDQVVARLQTAYAYLGQGQVTVTTPVGAETITYQQAGRAPDVEFMADAAMRIGHTGNQIEDAVYMLQSAVNGESVPIAVRLDPMAVATSVRQLVDTTRVLPADAHVTPQGGDFSVARSTLGQGIDETAISNAIVESLASPDAPATFQAGGAFIEVVPRITDKDAQDAIATAEKMAVDLHLTWSGEATTQSPSASSSPSAASSPSASPSQTPAPLKTYTIDAQTIRGWITFGTRTDGSYGPSIDPTPLQTYLSGLAPELATTPVEPSVVFDSSGKPAGVKNGKDGASLDVTATSQTILSYLGGLGSGAPTAASIAMIDAPISPRITPASLTGYVVIGSWTTIFFPGITNGFGANIRVPAAIFNGQIVQPGKQFSFLTYVGPVDRAHGFTLGGVIKDGKSDHTGAMGGGICSASTTMFNAAARAGLQIDERHPHYYYIDRYPVGLDATVYAAGGQVWDLKWTNDTPNPIVIRGSTTKGSKSSITIQLWSLPLDRKVTFSPAFKANVVRATDRTVYVTTLKPGQQNRAEYPTAGFATSRTRTVTDSTGKVIHLDTWVSRYAKVDGLLQIGRAKTPAPTPPPGAPAPTSGLTTPATLAPAPIPTPAPRRRTVR